LRALAGKADVGQVVQAISAAETTLQATIAVRDRVVQAYQEIIRMPI
jgi:flagellar hook-basal body complex protein FliE